MGKSAVARSDAEWIWQTYLLDAKKDGGAWLSAQLDNVLWRDRTCQFLLQHAVEAEDWGAFELLVSQGAAVDGGAMEVAIYRDDAAMLRRLLAAGGDVNAICCDGPAICEAIARGNHSLVALLLDEGADIEFEYATTLGTPLMWAAFRGDAAMVELLLARGADPTVRYDWDTPETVALRGGHKALAKMLRERAESSEPSDGQQR